MLKDRGCHRHGGGNGGHNAVHANNVHFVGGGNSDSVSRTAAAKSRLSSRSLNRPVFVLFICSDSLCLGLTSE